MPKTEDLKVGEVPKILFPVEVEPKEELLLNAEGNVPELKAEGDVPELKADGDVPELNAEGDVPELNAEGDVVEEFVPKDV